MAPIQAGGERIGAAPPCMSLVRHKSVRHLVRRAAAPWSVAALVLLGATSNGLAGGACPCTGDLSGDGTIDGADLGALLAAWGPCAGCPADLTGNGTVDGADLGILLSGWGPCVGGPPNDSCADAINVTSFTGSANPFCTIGATTDGPAIPSGCAVPPIDGIQGDVWFRVVAPVTATLQLGVCADFPVRIAVYGENTAGACSCTGGGGFGPVLACAGTAAYPACPQGAAVLVPAQAGDCLTVRIGGPAGVQGTGNLDINVYVPPCALASSTTLAASGLEANTEFGISVDISDDVGVAGAIFDDLLFGGASAGTARVYRYNGQTWDVEQTLVSPDAFASQRFGINVAASGDRIIVGAGTVDADCLGDPNCDTGIAYVYQYQGGTWSIDQSLTPSGGSPEDQFGVRVDIDGGRAIVGASDDDNANGTRAGAAYVYEFVNIFGGLWLQSAKLLASDGADFDQFGSDVGVSGTWAVVGADSGGAANTGAAYLFQDTGGAWPQVAKLEPTGLATGANFGRAVGIDGDVVVIGAPGNVNSPGAAYVYENFGAQGWLRTATLTAPDGANGDRFGIAVSVSGDQIMIGATGDDGSRGSAYVFWKVSGGWVERAKLTAADGVAGDNFGVGAIHNGLGLVGAFLDNVGLTVDRGNVYTFNGLGECTGNGVADACDIANGLADSDGDGIPDVCEP